MSNQYRHANDLLIQRRGDLGSIQPAWWMGGLLLVAGLAASAYFYRRTRFDPTIDE
jgi:hypothetical protein